VWHQCSQANTFHSGAEHRHEILVSSLTRNNAAVLLGLPAPSVSFDEMTSAQAHLPAHHVQNKESLPIVAIEHATGRLNDLPIPGSAQLFGP
jgi:hypothetical protein